MGQVSQGIMNYNPEDLSCLDNVEQERFLRARHIRENGGIVPKSSPESIAVARFLRLSGALKGSSYRNRYPESGGDRSSQGVNAEEE